MASRLRQIALNGNAGAFTNILATGPCRSIEMMEDEAAAPVGLQVQSLLDNFATTNVFSFGSEPLTIPNVLRYPNFGTTARPERAGYGGEFQLSRR